MLSERESIINLFVLFILYLTLIKPKYTLKNYIGTPEN